MIDERFPQWLVDVEQGKIYSLKHKRYIGNKHKDGYVNVRPPKGYKHNGVHRIIWMVANRCDIPEGYDIHHIDHNRQNNSIYNLELVELHVHISEHKIGTQHTDETKKKISEANKGTKLNRKDLSKQVAQYTLDGELIKIWESTRECGRNGFIQCGVSACCRGERKKHKGFKWKYLNE